MSQDKSNCASENFSAGHLTNPQPGDPRFEKFEDAVTVALNGSNDEDIWADGTSLTRRRTAHYGCAIVGR